MQTASADFLPGRLLLQLLPETQSEHARRVDHRGRELLNSYRPGVEKPRYRKVDYYKLTDKRIELRNASAATKMPRTKTNQIIVSLLKRVEEADAIDFEFQIHRSVRLSLKSRKP